MIEPPLSDGARAAGAPEISVIVAAFNAASFLAASVDSALSQGGVDLEVIVADDASTDNTVATAQALAASDSRIRLLTTDENGGPSAARNRAIDAARGAWIAVLDADDRFLPGRLAKLQAFAQEKNADVVFDLLEEVDETATEPLSSKAPRYEYATRWDFAFWAAANAGRDDGLGPGYLKPFLRRTALTDRALRYDERLRNSEDYLLIARLLATGAAVWIQPEVGYLYTRRAGSISHRIGPAHLEALLLAETEAFADAGLDTIAAAAQRDRVQALENALTCERVIDALKQRKILAALQLLAVRPSAVRPFRRWVGEVLGKRAARLGLGGDASFRP